MTTTRTFTATTGNRVFADLASHIGRVNVTVDPSVRYATITVSTADDEGPIAEAVLGATSREYRYKTEDVLSVSVPKVNGGCFTQVNGVTFAGGSVSFGGSSFNFSGNVNTGVVMSGGDIFIGGQRIVSNGRVVAEAGTVVAGTGSGTITVDVTVGGLSSVRLETTSADIAVRGAVQLLDVHSVSGDIEADTVHTLDARTTSGDVEIDTIQARADITSVSGDLEIRQYEGSGLRATTTSGDIRVTATSRADGSASITTVSGDITTSGTQHLALRPRTVSGKVRNR